MTEEQIQKLAEEKAEQLLPEYSVYGFAHKHFIEGYKAAILQNKDKWISVEDKKQSPNEGDYVLVNIGKNIILKGRRMINGWTAFFADGEKLCDAIRPVTHWQPLPTPPEQTVTQ